MQKIAIISKVLASSIYAISNTLTKFLSSSGVYNLTFITNFVATIFITIFIILQKISLKTKNIHLHFIRSLFYSMGTLLWFTSLSKLSIGEVTTLGSGSAIWSILGGIIFLHEKLTKEKVIAIACGIIGSTIMVSHKMTIDIQINYYTFFPILANICYAMCNIIGRKTKNDSEYVTVFYQYIISLPLIGTYLGFDLSKLFEYNVILVLIFLQSILSVSAYIFTVKAVKFAELISLIPFGIIRPFLGFVLGWMFFNEHINCYHIIGTIFMCLSIVLAMKIKQ